MVVNGISTGEGHGDGFRGSAWQALSLAPHCALLPAEATLQQRWVPPSLAQEQLLHETIQSLKDKAAQAFAQIDDASLGPRRETYCDGGLFGAGCNYEFGLHGLLGQRVINEDYVLHLPLGPNQFAPFDDCSRACLACVLDGHGGTGAVQYVAERFPTLLLEDLVRLRREPAAAMRAALHRVDEELTCLGHNSGTTVNALLLLDDRLTVINTGDCRCIVYDWLTERTAFVTADHNLRCSAERERVRAAGGEVSSCGDYVVLPCATEGAKLLGVTKALGHASVKALQRSTTGLSLSGGSGGGSSLLDAFSPSGRSPPREPAPSPLAAAVAAAAAASGAGVGGGEGVGSAEYFAAPQPPCSSGPSSSGPSSSMPSGLGVAAGRSMLSLSGMSIGAAAAATAAAAAAAAAAASATVAAPSAFAAASLSLTGMCSGASSGRLGDDASGSASAMSDDEGPHPALRSMDDGEGEGEEGGGVACSCAQQPRGAGLCPGCCRSASGPAAAAASASAHAPAAAAPFSRHLPPLAPHTSHHRTEPSPRSLCPPRGVTFARHSTDATSGSGYTAAAASPRHADTSTTPLPSPAGASPTPAAAASAAATAPPLSRTSLCSGGSFVLTCEPDVFEWTVQDDRHLILLACDGVFDKLSNSDACTTALRQLAESNSCLDAARMVTERALRKESIDNITALVMRLGRKPIQRRKSMSVLNLRRCGSNTSGDLAASGGSGNGSGAGNGGCGGGSQHGAGGSGGAGPSER